MSLQAPPDECLDDLVYAEKERERCEPEMAVPTSNMTNGVDADHANDRAPDEISLRGESHLSIRLAGTTCSSAPSSLAKVLARVRTLEKP